jgi:hypothetical protein
MRPTPRKTSDQDEQEQSMTIPPMPPLPMPFDHIHTLESSGDVEDVPVYTENQLRTYAEQYGRLCAEAEREACAQVCDEVAQKHLNSGHYISIVGDRAVRAGGQVDGAEESARAIRARSQR